MSTLKSCGIQVILANGTKMEAEWDRLVREYHYLGLGKMIGRRVKYLVTLEGEPMAAISFDSFYFVAVQYRPILF